MIHASASLITQAGQYYFLLTVVSFRLEIPGVTYRLMLPVNGWVWTGESCSPRREALLWLLQLFVCLFSWTVGLLKKILYLNKNVYHSCSFKASSLMWNTCRVRRCLAMQPPSHRHGSSQVCDTAPDLESRPRSVSRMIASGFRPWKGTGVRTEDVWALSVTSAETRVSFWHRGSERCHVGDRRFLAKCLQLSTEGTGDPRGSNAMVFFLVR